MIKNLIFGVSELISDFLVEFSKPTKTSKKDHSFYNTVLLQKPHSFYEPHLTQYYKTYTPATQPKTCFWLVSEEKHLHCIITRCPRTTFSKHLESKFLYIPVNLR